MSTGTTERRPPTDERTTGTTPRGRRPLLQGNWAADFYRSAIGKKAVMAISGVVLLGYVFLHMVGNLKLYFGPEGMDEYAEWLRAFGAPAVPEMGALWGVRVLLIVAFALHIHAAVALTLMNRRARPQGYRASRDYVSVTYAARTMRWSGVIVALFVIYHLLHFTTGTVHPDFVEGSVYHNVVVGFQQWPVALFYIAANLLLGLHIYHGAWSMFQSVGWNSPRFNGWRRGFSRAFAGVIVLGNVSFPIAVMTGVVS
ncbi:MAG: succinate dehydrogenase [Nitriliruptorales bacterium]|nr:succinate dehydrogenase [Nitriliruptorales bacterium]